MYDILSRRFFQIMVVSYGAVAFLLFLVGLSLHAIFIEDIFFFFPTLLISGCLGGMAGILHFEYDEYHMRKKYPNTPVVISTRKLQ